MFNRSKRNLKNKKGFTLIELVVVIAVIGILAAIAIPRVTGVTKSAKENATAQHLATLNSAVERYLAEGKSSYNIDSDTDGNQYIHDGTASKTKLTGTTEANAEKVIGYLQGVNYLSSDVSIDTLPNGNTLYFDASKNVFVDSKLEEPHPNDSTK